MRIISPWRDYYDVWADGRGRILQRTGGNSGPLKREQFQILENAGWLTPLNGYYPDIIDEWWAEESQEIKNTVVYIDELAHCTEGKILVQVDKEVSPDEWLKTFAIHYNHYASAFVGDPNIPGESWRRLQIGPHVFWIEYRSNSSWMSNDGEGTCDVIGVEWNIGYHHSIRLPLFAVDFVLGREMYALDFNTAPGIRGSGVEKILSGKDCHDAIERALEEL